MSSAAQGQDAVADAKLIGHWRDAVDAVRSLDLEKAQMQSVGSFLAVGLTLAQVVEVVTDLGIDPNSVEITNGIVAVKT